MSSGWGGTYTELSLWDAGVYGRLCLDHSAPLTCGWEVDIRFDPAVNTLDVSEDTIQSALRLFNCFCASGYRYRGRGEERGGNSECVCVCWGGG